jgi:hypothetical protein
MARPETHMATLWPRGQCVEYRGDPLAGVFGDRPRPELRWPTEGSIRNLYSQSWKAYRSLDLAATDPWREGTPDEWREIQRSVQAERLEAQDIYCVDRLVVELLNFPRPYPGFSWEDISNTTVDPSDWSRDQCRAWLEDHTNADTTGVQALSACQELVTDHAGDHQAEIFEWYRVSTYLGEALEAAGYVTLRNDYGDWWGRTTTGQALIMDGVLQDIAGRSLAQLEARRHQRQIARMHTPMPMTAAADHHA